MRMNGRGEFQRVRTEGRAFPGRYLVLSIVPSADLPVPFRFGIILTRKIGKAVTRNRIRRRMKGILSEWGERIAPGHLIVVIARYRAPEATFQQLRHDWKVLARKAGLLGATALPASISEPPPP